MLVLAAVPEMQVLRLRRAAGARFGFVPASAWGDVVDLICRQPIELAVVDPMLSGEPRSQEIERLRLLFPSLPVLLYTTFTSAPARLRIPGVTAKAAAKRLGYSKAPPRQRPARFSPAPTGGKMPLSQTPDAAWQLAPRRFTTLPRATAESEAS